MFCCTLPNKDSPVILIFFCSSTSLLLSLSFALLKILKGLRLFLFSSDDGLPGLFKNELEALGKWVCASNREFPNNEFVPGGLF